jgi:FixJ family two-component response regulator
MDSEPIIYVVDDDRDSRDSAAALVQQMGLKVQSFASAEEFLKAYNGHRPACLLTDHRMLGMTGVELLESLRTNGISLSVVIMTAYAETELTVRAIRSGAVTLLEKPFVDSALWEAIREALAEDRRQFDREIELNQIMERIDSLTPSELDVLKLAIKGEPNKAVAMRLGVSIRTVENRRSSIFDKMDVASVAELVQQVMMARPDLA